MDIDAPPLTPIMVRPAEITSKVARVCAARTGLRIAKISGTVPILILFVRAAKAAETVRQSACARSCIDSRGLSPTHR